MWFKNKRDEGVVYPDLFSPISVPSIALILTAVSKFQRLFHESNPSTQQIESNLDEWISGTKTEVTLWVDDYCAIYKSHVLSLASIQGLKVLISLVNCNIHFIIMDGESFFLFNVNIISFKPSLHVGVSTLVNWTQQAIPHSAFIDAVNAIMQSTRKLMMKAICMRHNYRKKKFQLYIAFHSFNSSCSI